MSAHTPGPWHLDTVPINNGSGSCHRIGPFPSNGVYLQTFACVYADNIRIGIDDIGGVSKVGDELAANARLIAAAPDLLEAARAAYTRLADIRNDWYGRHTSEGQRLLCMLRDAISKATGMDAEDVQDAASVPQATGAQS